MKITPYKLARVKSILPQEDRDEIDKQVAEGKFKPETRSLIAKYANLLSPKRLSKTKGAFGKRGTDRKEYIRLKKIAKLKEAIDIQKELETDKKDG